MFLPRCYFNLTLPTHCNVFAAAAAAIHAACNRVRENEWQRGQSPFQWFWGAIRDDPIRLLQTFSNKMCAVRSKAFSHYISVQQQELNQNDYVYSLPVRFIFSSVCLSYRTQKVLRYR